MALVSVYGSSSFDLNNTGTVPIAVSVYQSETLEVFKSVVIIEPNFLEMDFESLAQYNFTYGTCDYCPGEYWPDNKTGNHTLVIFATEQPLSDALLKLKKLVKDNVYV